MVRARPSRNITAPGSVAQHQGPVRTCVGCRTRAAKHELLRVVSGYRGGRLAALPDPDGRAPGRGAYLHPTPACLEQMERRKTLSRALRVRGTVDGGPLRDKVRLVNDNRR